jgi:Right handed beta helix region
MRALRRRSAWLGVTALAIGAAACGGSVEADPSAAPAVAKEQDALTAGRAVRFVSARFGSDTRGGGANDCLRLFAPCRTIQHAVDVADAGNAVVVGAGEYAENVIVPKSLVVVGEGERTVLRPAVSAPAPCTDDTLCGGAASTIVLVRANDVHLYGLTLDGDNPALATGIDVGGANIDARNGIVTDYDAGSFDGVTVDSARVRNIYHRGVYGVSAKGFTVTRTHVRNVRGEAESIAIFGFAASGAFTDNAVEGANDAISANHSLGTTFARNRVRASESGVHTDNAGDGAGATADVLEDNEVSDCTANGFGVWVFVPWVAPLVRRNTVTSCSVGLALFGEGAAGPTRFDGNRVRGNGGADTVGALVTTDLGVFGAANAEAELRGNLFTHTGTGLLVEETAGDTASVLAECNTLSSNAVGVRSASAATHLHDDVIARNTVGVDGTALSRGTLDATRDYWGCAAGPGGASCDTIQGSVDASSPLASPPRCAPGGRRDEANADATIAVAAAPRPRRTFAGRR